MYLSELIKSAFRIRSDKMATDPVHAFRVGTKRVRSVLRLSKQTSRRRKKIKVLRNLARELAPLRDTIILNEQLNLALAADQASLKPIETEMIQKQLERRATQLSSSRNETLKRVGLGLKKIAADSTHERKEVLSESDLIAALCRSYRQAKRSQANCQKQRSVSEFHEWRKSTKILQYQLEAVLKYQRPKNKTVSALSDLADLLGQIQDLSAFVRFLKNHRAHSGKMRHTLRRKRSKLESEALNDGDKVFKFKAKHWIKDALVPPLRHGLGRPADRAQK